MPICILITVLIHCYCLVAFFDINYQKANHIYGWGLIWFIMIVGLSMIGVLKSKYITDGRADKRYKENMLVNEKRGIYLFLLPLWVLAFFFLIRY